VTTCPPAPAKALVAPDDRLLILANLFEARFLDLDREEGSPPHLLGVAFDDDTADDTDGADRSDDADGSGTNRAVTGDGRKVRLHLKALDVHPSEALMGWYAPDEWWCLGVAAGGWASTDGPDQPCPPRQPRPSRSTDRDRRRVRLLHLVTREGEAINVLHQRDAEPLRARWSGPDIERAGMIDDCLRCALRLPTAPPPDTTIELWALLWIHRVLEAATDGRLNRATWPDVARLHTTFAFIEPTGDDELLEWSVEQLGRAGELLARAYPWTRIHRECAAGVGPAAGLAPDVVEWMDLGMFARTTLATLPPLEDTVLDLFDLLRAEPYCRLIDALEHWGLHPG
jgi:hypothetical protein